MFVPVICGERELEEEGYGKSVKFTVTNNNIGSKKI